MKNKFSIYQFLNYLNEQEQEEQPQEVQPVQNQQQSPQQQQTSAPQPSADQAFRSLQGQTIAGVDFKPNGSTGGTITIKVKNSYVPFTISWANQQITVTDLSGNTMVIGDNNQ